MQDHIEPAESKAEIIGVSHFNYGCQTGNSMFSAKHLHISACKRVRSTISTALIRNRCFHVSGDNTKSWDIVT